MVDLVPTLNLVVGGVALAIAIIALVLSLAISLRLRRRCAELEMQIKDHGNDLKGLCASSVSVDRMLWEQEGKLQECLVRLDAQETSKTETQPYHSAIERIRRGARADDLVRDIGISQAEAELLIRLHGGDML